MRKHALMVPVLLLAVTAANSAAETPYAFRAMMPGTRFPAWTYQFLPWGMWQEGKAYATFQECEADRVEALAEMRKIQADLKKQLADPAFKKGFEEQRMQQHRTDPETAQVMERMLFGDHHEYAVGRFVDSKGPACGGARARVAVRRG
jgi:hypothetical protein